MDTARGFYQITIFLQQRQDQKRSDLDEQLKDYINEWRKQRAKEEDELKRLKEKQAKRKVTLVYIVDVIIQLSYTKLVVEHKYL